MSKHPRSNKPNFYGTAIDILQENMTNINPDTREMLAEQWVGRSCWLVIDNKHYEAVIVGRRCKFAKIAPIDATIPDVEFSWEAVERVMRRDKIFYS